MVVILALEDGVSGIHGILDYPEILASSGKIIILGVQDASRHSAALRVAETVEEISNWTRYRPLRTKRSVCTDPGPKVSTLTPELSLHEGDSPSWDEHTTPNGWQTTTENNPA